MRRASRRESVECKFTRRPRGKSFSDPDDIMPWKIKTVSMRPAASSSEASDGGSQRSAFIHFAFPGKAAFGLRVGSNISVRMTLFFEDESKSVARILPMKPPAPVMRIVGMAICRVSCKVHF